MKFMNEIDKLVNFKWMNKILMMKLMNILYYNAFNKI